MSAIKDIKPGDTVTITRTHEATGNTTTIQGVVHAGHEGRLWIEGVLESPPLRSFIDWGWSITDHKPGVELPTEPGFYIESSDPTSLTNLWKLAKSGRWISAAHSKYDDRAAEFAPFTRLVPENENRAQIAAEVIDWIASYIPRPGVPEAPVRVIQVAREHFGVES